jgi:hypothetical protein
VWEEQTTTKKKACLADITTRNTAKHNKDKEEWEIA